MSIPPPPALRPRLRDRRDRPGVAQLAALLFGVLAAVAFAVVRPGVGDLWAARARESAASHGVGTDYWFAWFGGTVPGHYSLLEPTLARALGSVALGVLSAVLVLLLIVVLLDGSPRPAAVAWVAALAVTLNLWSGRVPFLAGCVAMLAAAIAVRHRRLVAAVLFGVVTALLAPVCGAFLLLGLGGVVLHDAARRVQALVVGVVTGAALIAIALWFGLPGPEGFRPIDAGLTLLALAVLIASRPPTTVRTVLLAGIAVSVVVAVVPNGMGSNIERLAWFCLPVACVATSRARPLVLAVVVAVPLLLGARLTARDLDVAAEPMSSASYYSGLAAALDARHTDLLQQRLEVVSDGTHVAAYALLDHAQLARGYETQSDNAHDAVLQRHDLDARRYRAWLDDNAVGFVALGRSTLSANPEDALVRTHRPAYLREVWHDHDWRLFAVQRATPIAAAPARVTGVSQSGMELYAPTGTIEIRVRWSHLLDVDGARISRAPDGWTLLHATGPGPVRLSG